jgi:molybdopterin molybdotransferase
MAPHGSHGSSGSADDTPTARTSVDVHAARVDAALEPLRTRALESVELADALGRVTFDDVRSPIDLPPFRNSQMDGYAVRAADVASAPVSLPVVGEVAAAAGAPAPLRPGTAVKIMTGAPVPEGADTIVPVEDTLAANDYVSIPRGRGAGEYIREPGSDLRAGQAIVPWRTRLASRHLAALAAAGITDVDVIDRVRIAVISTGSELVAPGEPLGPGQIPDSNGIALAAAAQAAGADVVLRARTHDDPPQLAALLDEAVALGAELILTSGGVSMGDHEVVRELLEPLGAVVDVLAMQPGGPQALASWPGLEGAAAVPVVCFPGNPVSSQLSFELFVAPALREIAGLPEAARETRVLDSTVRSIPGRRQFLRGRRTDGGGVTTVAGPSSHLVAALAASDVLIVIPENVTELAAGDSVETWEL